MQLMCRILMLLGSIFFLAAPAQAQVTCEPADYQCVEWSDGATVGGISVGRYCMRYAGVQNCVDKNPEDQCSALRASLNCTQDSETCIEHENGQCRQWRHEFTCFNENADMSPAVLTSTTFGVPRESFDSTCGTLENNSDCQLTQTLTTEGAETRTINRMEFYRAWWQKERTYSCRVPGEGENDCAPLESDPTCQLTGDTCLVEEDGICSNRQYHYRCGIHSGDLQTSWTPLKTVHFRA